MTDRQTNRVHSIYSADRYVQVDYAANDFFVYSPCDNGEDFCEFASDYPDTAILQQIRYKLVSHAKRGILGNCNALGMILRETGSKVLNNCATLQVQGESTVWSTGRGGRGEQSKVSIGWRIHKRFFG